MKSLFLVSFLALLFLSLNGCKSREESVCHIYGEMADHSRDGKKVYLVPFIRPDSVGVDSTVIVDGKFEFVTRKYMLAIVRIELLSRYGIQDLLVVTEPGDVQVWMDSISRGGGTPQNEVLQQWKEDTQAYGRAVYACRQQQAIPRDSMLVKLDSLWQVYRASSRALADKLEEGPLRDFLEARFPDKPTAGNQHAVKD